MPFDAWSRCLGAVSVQAMPIGLDTLPSSPQCPDAMAPDKPVRRTPAPDRARIEPGPAGYSDSSVDTGAVSFSVALATA